MDRIMRYKTMYKRGILTVAELEKMVEKGIITQEQYDFIIAND